MRRRSRAFSIIEILMVLVLIALVLGLLLNNTGTSRANRQVDAAAKELEGALVLAHQTAINRGGANVTIVPPAAGPGSYTVTGNTTGANMTATVSSGSLPPGVNVVVSPAATISFLPSGGCNITSGNTITVNVTSSRTQRSYLINVTRLTGSVTSTLTRN